MNDLELEDAPLQTDAAAGKRPIAKPQPAQPAGPNAVISGVRIGALVGMTDEGRTPLVVFPGQKGSAAVAARATLDLHGDHVGRDVVLMFEDGDATRPIVIGCLPAKAGWPMADRPNQVEVDADGERLLVTAKDQLVLRCGKASITLTKAGKILIDGAYVSSRSSGVIRIKGGSVQLN